MKTVIVFCILLLTANAYSQNFEVKSPNQSIQLVVTIDNGLTWKAYFKEKEVIKEAKIAIEYVENANFTSNFRVKNHTIKEVSSVIYPAVPHKDATINDVYTELSLLFKNKNNIVFRVYNDGIAYQFIDNQKKSKTVKTEDMAITFPNGSTSLFPKEDSMYSHNERIYLDKPLTDIATDEFCSLPVLFDTGNAKVLFTETALHNYPGMFIKGNGTTTVNATFPKCILKIKDEERQPDRNQTIVEEADYIAKIEGKKEYPWRVFMISDDDRTFVESNLTYQLATPTKIKNTQWIKPGKVAWDWYNANNIYGVDFESGLNTATYKYYIDFAAANNIEYVILDEGWTKSTIEILDFNSDMDVREIIKYGKEKDVGIILWVLWKPLDANLDTILETYKSWGAKGVKVDFMQRNDQYMVNSYEKIAKKCAELELLVDFHGSFKPSGLRRAYPNIVNYEGVKGSENNKWSKDVTPKHNVTIPFIRMAAGPMDYTPGAMTNKHEKNFGISFERPSSLGTRAHQVAMYVVYEAPLQMLCESPSRYKQEQETVDFITQIPTTWDETIVLHGSVGEYIAVARRKGDNWYIGAMTNETARELALSLSFLGKGNYKMNVFKDGANAKRFAEDYSTEITNVTNTATIKATMVSGGGWVAVLTKE